MVSNRYASATDTGVRRVAGGEARPVRAGGGPFGWLGRAVVRHPWRVIALWVIAAVAVIATSPGLPTTSSESSFLPSTYESIRAANLQDQAFPQAGHVTSSAAMIVFARADNGRLTGADSARIAAIARSLGSRHIPSIVGITAGAPSPNHLVQTALVAMPDSVVNGSGTAAGDAVKVLRADIKPLMAGTGLTEGVTGSAAQQLDSQQSSTRADQIVLFATLALILILLLVIFRSPVIALLPLVVIALVSQVATGLISDVNKALHLNADSSISTILIVVLFGIGTDYTLFLMFRYRERLRAGEDAKQAMVSAVTRVGDRRSRADPGRHVRLADPGREHHPVPDRVRRVLWDRAGRVRDGHVLLPGADRAHRAPRLVARSRGQAPDAGHARAPRGRAVNPPGPCR